MEGAKIYCLLDQLFKESYVINEKTTVIGGVFFDQKWPEVQKSCENCIRNETVSYRTVEMTLLEYLESKLNLRRASSFGALTTGAPKPSLFCSDLSQSSVLMTRISCQNPSNTALFVPFSSSLPCSIKSSETSYSGNVKSYHYLPWSESDWPHVFSSPVSSPKIFCEQSTALLIREADIENKNDALVQEAINLLNSSTYYETFDGKGAVVKKGKIIALERGVQFYPKCEGLPGFYRLDDGTISCEGIRNVKYSMLLNNQERILKVIHRLASALLEPSGLE
ncbi:MAG TPA: hypothetical protein DCE71_08480 [Parachlamydiales bacterium]|nr:hypothetical protein [Parachlamydiales bacterium]